MLKACSRAEPYKRDEQPEIAVRYRSSDDREGDTHAPPVISTALRVATTCIQAATMTKCDSRHDAHKSAIKDLVFISCLPPQTLLELSIERVAFTLGIPLYVVISQN